MPPLIPLAIRTKQPNPGSAILSTSPFSFRKLVEGIRYQKLQHVWFCELPDLLLSRQCRLHQCADSVCPVFIPFHVAACTRKTLRRRTSLRVLVCKSTENFVKMSETTREKQSCLKQPRGAGTDKLPGNQPDNEKNHILLTILPD